MKKFIILVAILLTLACTAAFAQSSEVEPNNTKSLADPVKGMTIRGKMSSKTDVDWYVLNGQEGVNPTFTINHASGVDFDFEVWSGEEKVATCSGTTSPDSETVNVPGKCYIKVYSFRGSGSYTITITP